MKGSKSKTKLILRAGHFKFRIFSNILLQLSSKATKEPGFSFILLYDMLKNVALLLGGF